MSTKLTKAEKNPEGAKSGSTLVQSRQTGVQKQNGGSENTPPTAEEVADLLARLMDIQASWQPAQKPLIYNNVVMAGFIIPSGVMVGTMLDGHGRLVYTVNGVPVVEVA